MNSNNGISELMSAARTSGNYTVQDEKLKRRKFVREWGAEVRSLGAYHRDRWEESLSANEDYEDNEESFKELKNDYVELARHPEYHY